MQARLLEFLEGETLSGYLSPGAVRAIGALAATVDVALADLDAPARRAPASVGPARGAGRARPNSCHTSRMHDAAGGARGRGGIRVGCRRARWRTDFRVQFIHGDLTDDNVVTADPVTRIPDGVIDLGDLNRTWTIGELAITVSSLLHHDGMDLPAAMRAVARVPRDPPDLGRRGRRAVGTRRRPRRRAGRERSPRARDGRLERIRRREPRRTSGRSSPQATSVPLAVATALVRAATGHARVRPRASAGRRCSARVWMPPMCAPSISRPTSPAAARRTMAGGLRRGRPLRCRLLVATGAAVAPVRRGAPDALSAGRPSTSRATWRSASRCASARRSPSRRPWAGHGLADRGRPGAARPSEIDAARRRMPHGTRGRLDGRSAGDVIARGDRQAVGAGIACGRGCAAVRHRPRSPRRGGRSSPIPRRSCPGTAERTVRLDAPTLLHRRDASFADVQEHYYDDPPVMVRGWREHLIDADGRVYLDTLNNVTSVGHAHPRLVDAVAEQWRLLNTNSRFHYPAVVEFSERLAALVPDPLDTVFLVNSGSEAVDLALRLAQAWSGRRDVLAVREAYHGWTYLTDAVSTSVADNPAALETRPGVGAHRRRAESVPRRASAAPRRTSTPRTPSPRSTRLAAAGTPVGAFLSETVFGNAGGIALPDGYLDGDLPRGARARRSRDRRRGAGRLRTPGRVVLGVRAAGRRARRRRRRQGDGQRASARRGHHDARDRRALPCGRLLLLLRRRQSGLQRRRAGRARHHPRRTSAGERPRHRCIPEGAPAKNSGSGIRSSPPCTARGSISGPSSCATARRGSPPRPRRPRSATGCASWA